MELTKEDAEMLYDQVKLLADWNKENIKAEPEQVRRNIETIVSAYFANPYTSTATLAFGGAATAIEFN